jgi:hypothetical protein
VIEAFPLSLAILVLCGLVFGFFNRLRGGGFWHTGSTQLARVMWALPVGVLFGISSESLIVAAFTVVAAFIGLLSGNGRLQNDDSKDWKNGAAVGVARLYLIFLPSFIFHAPSAADLLLPILGVLQGAAYAFGWKYLHGYGVKGLRGGSEWGELLTGFAFGLAFGTHFLINM